jgi:hypothetical protein
MKTKKNIFFLLFIVLLIWGGVIYQFFSFASTPKEEKVIQSPISLNPLTFKERDTFSINVNYRDPFLGKMYKPQTKVYKKAKVKTVPKVQEPIVWPTILYKGIVSDTKEKNKIFMLIINGQTFLMKKGTVEQEVFLKEGNRESVYVKYKGNLNLIMLQE